MFEIGTSLREARLRQGLDFPQAEQATKIRGKYLRALEDEQFGVLPSQTYVKGFLRSYAEYLGLDGQLYVDEFNSRYISGEDETPLRPRRSSAGRSQRRVESRVVVAALVVIAVLVALTIAAFRYGAAKPQQTPVSNRTNAAPAATPRAVAPAARKALPPTRLVVRATRGSSWLQARSGGPTGKIVYGGTLDQGKALPLNGVRFWVNVGIPENLTATVNGRAASFPGAGPEIVVVTRNGIAPAPRA
jgi:hypothetical protein